MYRDRALDYIKLEEMFDTKILTYVTGDRAGWETQIGADVLDYFLHHLDTMGSPKKISLFLYTRGGDTLAGWSIVNLIRQFCDEFEVIVPSKCHSTGTLMCLGANSIVMTKQATLGPIDPSVNTPLNPLVPGGNQQAKYAVSVEDVKGYLDWAKSELNIKNEQNLSEILVKLSDLVHPLVLGKVYRAKAQIQMLAKKLLINQNLEDEKIDNIIAFLASDSGSHDYTIYRREAQEHLGLKIVKPDQEKYNVIKRLYNDISEELKLREPYSQESILGSSQTGSYDLRRCLIESIDGGCHFLSSEGVLSRVIIPSPHGNQNAISDNRIFEGWRYEDAPRRNTI